MTYDWAEALVALNLCIKPLIDHLFMVQLGKMGAGARLSARPGAGFARRRLPVAPRVDGRAARDDHRPAREQPGCHLGVGSKMGRVAGPAASAFESWFDVDKDCSSRTWSTLHRRLGIARVEVT